jgi:hypothetical protein
MVYNFITEENLKHPAYRPDQAPSDYNPFPAVNHNLGSQKDNEVDTAVI